MKLIKQNLGSYKLNKPSIQVRSLIHFDKANRALPLFVNECLSYCLKFNRPLVGISLVRLLIADDLLKISRVTVNLATRILTLVSFWDIC
jgi:hypothetical protein